VPWNTGSLHSERRYHLGRAIVRLAGHLPPPPGEWDDGGEETWALLDVVRGLLGEATGREEEVAHLPLGHVIGLCGYQDAEAFAVTVDEYLSPNSAA
jgi:hypothetical protein